jgi:hypothetical protein
MKLMVEHTIKFVKNLMLRGETLGGGGVTNIAYVYHFDPILN